MEWILELRHESLTPIFVALTFLGDATFFLIFMPLGYWLWRREAFYRLLLLLFVSAFLNSILKGIFQVPRPDVPHLVAAGGWSFPSGHAQIAATLWPALALELRRVSRGQPGGGVTWAAAAFLVAGVAASRVYLGVHYPVDVLTGIALGLALVALARRLLESPVTAWERLGPLGQSGAVLLGLALGYATLGFTSGGEMDSVAMVAGGALTGFWFGALSLHRHFEFAAPEGWGKRLAVAVLGLAGAFGLRFALKAAFDALGLDWRIADFLRYAAIGAWLSYLGPWLFHRLALVRLAVPVDDDGAAQT